jgi:hypothetical protein
VQSLFDSQVAGTQEEKPAIEGGTQAAPEPHSEFDAHGGFVQTIFRSDSTIVLRHTSPEGQVAVSSTPPSGWQLHSTLPQYTLPVVGSLQKSSVGGPEGLVGRYPQSPRSLVM